MASVTTSTILDPSGDPTPAEANTLDWGAECSDEEYSTDGSDDTDCSDEEYSTDGSDDTDPSDSDGEVTDPASAHIHTHGKCGGECGGHATSDDDYNVSEEDAVRWLSTSAPSGLRKLVTNEQRETYNRKGQKSSRKGWWIGKGNDPTKCDKSLRSVLKSLRHPVSLTYCNKHDCGVVVETTKIIQHLLKDHRIEREVKLIKCRHCGEEVDDIVSHLKAKNCARKIECKHCGDTVTDIIAHLKAENCAHKAASGKSQSNGKSTYRPQQGAKSGNPSHQHKHNRPARQPELKKCRYCGCKGVSDMRQHLLANNCRFKAEQAVHEEEERQRASKPRRSKTSPKGSSTSSSSKGKAKVSFNTNANGFAGLKRKAHI